MCTCVRVCLCVCVRVCVNVCVCNFNSRVTVPIGPGSALSVKSLPKKTFTLHILTHIHKLHTRIQGRWFHLVTCCACAQRIFGIHHHGPRVIQGVQNLDKHRVCFEWNERRGGLPHGDRKGCHRQLHESPQLRFRGCIHTHTHTHTHTLTHSLTYTHAASWYWAARGHCAAKFRVLNDIVCRSCVKPLLSMRKLALQTVRHIQTTDFNPASVSGPNVF